MNFYKLALRNLEKIADNEAKGAPHPNDARDKIQHTAIIKDFAILYGHDVMAKQMIRKLADRVNKVIKKGPITSKDIAFVMKSIAEESKKSEEYIEQLRKPITEKRVERYELDCAAIKKLQAKKELNEVEEAALKNHQKYKDIFEKDMKKIEQKVEEYRRAKNKGIYRLEVTSHRYAHYKSSVAVVKDMESRKNLSAKSKETLSKHKIYMQEFELDLKHMAHKLKPDSDKHFEQNLYELLQTIKANEKKIMKQTNSIAQKHLESGEVENAKEWKLRLTRYHSFIRFIRECEAKDPATLTEKTKVTLQKHREYVKNYEKEMKELNIKYEYIDTEAEDEEEVAEKAKQQLESGQEVKQENAETAEEEWVVVKKEEEEEKEEEEAMQEGSEAAVPDNSDEKLDNKINDAANVE